MSNLRRPGIRDALLCGAAALGSLSAWAGSAAAGSPGCGSPAPVAGIYTMMHEGVARTYALSVPSGYDRHRPARLVLVFHGWGGDEREFLDDPTVVGESDRRGYVVAAPRGLGSGPPDNSRNTWTFRHRRRGCGARAGADLRCIDHAGLHLCVLPEWTGEEQLFMDAMPGR